MLWSEIYDATNIAFKWYSSSNPFGSPLLNSQLETLSRIKQKPELDSSSL